MSSGPRIPATTNFPQTPMSRPAIVGATNMAGLGSGLFIGFTGGEVNSAKYAKQFAIGGKAPIFRPP
jgi:hypothetical protein